MGQTIYSPFVGTFIGILFIFSTIYGLAYYYNQINDVNNFFNQPFNWNDPSDEQVQKAKTVESHGIFGFVFGVMDNILDAISWISPGFLLKLMMITITNGGYSGTMPELYRMFDLFIIRPVNWSLSLIMINYLISKIPTVSKE